MISFMLWALGIPTAMMILTLYFHRLVLYKMPAKEAMGTLFLPMGPLGQGGYAIQALGKEAMKVFPQVGEIQAVESFNDLLMHEQTNVLDPLAGRVFYILGFLVACLLWGFGLLWVCFAVVPSIQGRFPYNMGWWSFTFPVGVYAMCTIAIGADMPSATFRVLGEIFALAVILLWMMVFTLTARHSFLSLGAHMSHSHKDRGSKEVPEALADPSVIPGDVH
jgi:tellurite resistance protein TehA-like permease